MAKFTATGAWWKTELPLTSKLSPREAQGHGRCAFTVSQGAVAPHRPPPGISCFRQNHPIPGLAPQAALCRLRGRRRVSVPFHLVHAGDVLDLDGQGQFVVVMAVAEDKSGYLVIEAVSADDQPGQWRYSRKASPAAFARVGQGCAPTPNGLRRFLVKQQG